MENIDYYQDKVKPGRETRLYNEWKMMDTEYALHDAISYTINKRTPSGLPLVYLITFHIKSITGVEDSDMQGLQKPVFGDKHILRITIPNNYPSADGGYPEFTFISDVWHPNIRYYGDFKGHVCLNFESSGTSTSLAEFIDKVAAYLRYDEYHALDEEPFPEDQTVAKWVREQAEPQRWFNQLKIKN
jgi:ubiquitin-protein ligase